MAGGGAWLVAAKWARMRRCSSRMGAGRLWRRWAGGGEAGRCALAEESLDGGIHGLGSSSGQAAQQESLVMSRVKAWASLRPSPMVRYGAQVSASSSTVMPSLTA